jgi:hypothetical protein
MNAKQLKKNHKIGSYRTILGALLLLAFVTRSAPSLASNIPKGSDPYLFGGAAVNLVNELSIPTEIPYGGRLTHAHLESIFFLLFLVPFKLIFFDMGLVLRLIPGALGAINILGIYLFTKALTNDKSVAVISAFLLTFNPFHSYTTKIATPEGLALGLLFFSMYLLLENRVIFSGIFGGLILLTDYLIFGHFLIILSIYLATNFNRKNARKVTTVLFLTFLLALPWQLYLDSLSSQSSFAEHVGTIQSKHLIFNPVAIFDTLYFLPTAITPLHVTFVIGGLYYSRKREYFRFLTLVLMPFFILSFVNASLGVQPFRHIISLSVFSSVISAVFLDAMKAKRALFGFLFLLSVLSYFYYPLDFYLEIPSDTVNAADWLNKENTREITLSAPSPVYAVLTGKTTIHENNPCNNHFIDYVVDDRNFERWPTSYKGKTLEILDYKCLESVYSTKSIKIYKVTKSKSNAI